MKILVAPDKLKDSLTALEAAAAIADGARRAMPDVQVDLCPLSDGGEGFVQVLVEAHGGSLRETDVSGPLGDTVRAVWCMLPDGTAVLESAEAIGLARVPTARRDPTRATSFGLGQLVRAALDDGARCIVMGLGGSATNDGGIGLAVALGANLTPACALHPAGSDLARLVGVDRTRIDPRLAEVALVVATDVTSPLCGPRGAAQVFAPQKGATSAQVAALDAGLAHYAAVLGDPGTQPGDGAAGGLGYGLRVLCGARVTSGAGLVLDAVSFDARLADADLVITAEGRIDGQSAEGKVVGEVCRRAAHHGVAVVALAGALRGDLTPLYEAGLTACFAIQDGPRDEDEARARAAASLTATTTNLVRLVQSGRVARRSNR
ncbi:MAG: glycerate kinase [Polyangiales bacterium]